MPNTKSIANNNSGLIQGRCQINQSEDLNQAIDKDNLIDTAKTFIEYAGFDFEKNPISETCRLLSLKDMVVSDQIERYHGSKEIADIVEKVFDDYLANEMSKRERKLFENKFANKKSVSTVKKYDSNRDIFVIDNEEHPEPLERTCKDEDVIAEVKKIADSYIYSTEWETNRNPADEYKKLQYLESKARGEVADMYGLDDEISDTISGVFKEFYKSHPTIFFPTKPLERTCDNEDIVSAVKKLSTERLELFKYQENEDPSDAYIRFKTIESQVKNEVTSLYGQNTALLDAVSRVFNEYYEVHRYDFVTGNKESQEITDPVCDAEDTDEKEEAMELACTTEDTDAKPEEAPKVENATVPAESLDKEDGMVRHVVITDEEKVAVANKIAYDCVNKISFNHGEGETVELLRMHEAEREATSKIVEVYGDDKVALDALRDVFNCLYGNIKTFYEGEPKEEEVLVEKESIQMPDAPDDTTHEKKVDEYKFDKQLVKSMTEDVFGIGNEDAINAVLDIFDKQYSSYIGEVKVDKLIKKAILSYIAKEAAEYSGLRLSENKSDEQIHMFEAKKEAIEKAKEIYGDDNDLLDYVANEVELYATAIAATLHLPNKEEKKQNRPMPIITKPIGRRIPGMSHVVQQRPLSTTENMDNILLSKEEQKQLKIAESEALNNDSMVDYSNPSGKDIEDLITKIYGERSRKNLPKESQEQSEQKEEVPSQEKLHIGLARRIALSTENAYDSPLYGITRHILDEQYPNQEYLRPYKYGLVAPFGRREERFETERELQDIHCFVWPFNSLLRYRDNWLSNYYGYGTYYDGDLKFSIHRVCMDKGKYDYVVIENSHSTRPLSFPTKDMADNFLIVFRDLIEASGNLI